MRTKSVVSKVLKYLFILLLCAVFIYPLFNMAMKSLFTAQEINAYPPKLIPSSPQWTNYAMTLVAPGYYNGVPAMIQYFFNTAIVVVLCIIGGTISSTLCAYGFSKIKWRGREFVFMAVLATLMIPNTVLMIPQFVIFKTVHFLNTLLPLWVPAFFGGGAMNIFILRQFMRTMPNELIESGRMDGAGHFRIYAQLIMPNCKAVTSVVVINFFMACWNDLMGPLIYINDPSKWTLTLGITNFCQNTYGGVLHASYTMAACTMMVIPPIIVFFLCQDFFIDNVILSGIKG